MPARSLDLIFSLPLEPHHRRANQQIREPYYRQSTKIVKPQWIVDSIRLGKLQPVPPLPLFNSNHYRRNRRLLGQTLPLTFLAPQFLRHSCLCP